jgi:SAM-dependent methyltransferase
MLTLFKPAVRRGPEAPILDRLLDPEEIIDRFDGTYLDDLPEILHELYGVTGSNVREHALWPQLKELWELTGKPLETFELAHLPAALVTEAGVDPLAYAPKEAPKKVKRRYRHTRPRAWRAAAGVRLRDRSRDGEQAREVINLLQQEYSIQSGGGDQDVEFHDLGRPETGDPWSPLIRGLVSDGTLFEEEPMLTIGPRWVGEIYYFREALGLRYTIGLDLFSSDPELVTVGDMHRMPFGDDTFGLIYQRNTFDKSSDIRAALRECMRTLRTGGVLISDDCYAYTDGVSELARTNVKHNRQIIRVISVNVAEVVYDRETESSAPWIERVGQLALKVRK